MIFSPRRLQALLTLIACIVLAGNAFGEKTRDITQFGHDIAIGPSEQVLDATCFGCSIRVSGQVKTDVTIFGGSLIVEDQAEIGTDVTVFGGRVRLEPGAKVNGDVTVFGGKIERDPAAVIAGSVTDFNGGIWIFLIFVLPLMVLGGLITLIVLLIRRLTRPAVRTVPTIVR